MFKKFLRNKNQSSTILTNTGSSNATSVKAKSSKTAYKSLRAEFDISISDGVSTLDFIADTIDRIRRTKICLNSEFEIYSSDTLEYKFGQLSNHIAEATKLLRVFNEGYDDLSASSAMKERLDSLKDGIQTYKRELHGIANMYYGETLFGTKSFDEIQVGSMYSLADLSYNGFMLNFECDFNEYSPRIKAGYFAVLCGYIGDTRNENFVSKDFMEVIARELPTLAININQSKFDHEDFWRTVFMSPILKVYVLSYFLNHIKDYDEYERKKAENNG